MSDLIERKDAIEAITYPHLDNLTREERIAHIEAIPSADIPHSDDWEKYSDKLWKTAYERGKADRPKGEWIKRHGTINCSVCKRSNWSACFEDTVRSFNFCPNCGSDNQEREGER